MYGDRVFEAVLEAGEAESGVSIHLVVREYDTGPIVRQCKVRVLRGGTPSAISEPACGHEGKSSWSKRLQESPQVTPVSPQGQAKLVSVPKAFSYRP